MHCCLQITEVVRNVCDDMPNRDLFSMALTCRAFLDPSLGALWREIDSYAPLIACIPHYLWEKVLSDKEVVSLIVLNDEHTLLPKHLKRYQEHYAHRIRVFRPDIEEGEDPIIPSIPFFQALQTATQGQPGALSPLLKEMDWMSPQDEFNYLFLGASIAHQMSSYMSLFVGASVEAMKFDAYPKIPLHAAAILVASQRFTKLKRLDISSEAMPRIFDQLMEAASWNYLEDLTMDDFHSSRLPFLASLPRLSHLSLHQWLETPPSQDSSVPLSARGFTSLQGIDLDRALDSSLVIVFLQYLAPANRLNTLKVAFPDLALSSAASQSLIDAIANHCNPTALQHLSLDDDPYGLLHLFQKEDTLELPIAETTDIRPLFRFHCLESVKLKLVSGLDLAPTIARRIPQSWPRIQELRLSTDPTGYSASLDHSDLLEIARGCPSLASWNGAFIDFSRAGLPERRATPDSTAEIGRAEGIPPLNDAAHCTSRTMWQPCALKRLSLVLSNISSPMRVATFFTENFPTLKEIVVNVPTLDGREKNKKTPVCKRWAALRTLMRERDVSVELRGW